VSESWSGKLLVATPLLTEATFSRTVVLLLQSDPEDGALGVVVNRASGLEVAEVLPGWGTLAADPAVVFEGGPVQPQAAVCLGRGRRGGPPAAAFSLLHDGPAAVLGTVDLDARPDDLLPTLETVRVFAGYAGWSPGQLEGEVEEGAWWVLDALPGDAFSPRPELLWQQVVRRQGAPIAFAAHYPPDPALN
jgi:putative transcriptional regulator